ncbi:hypothetical protein Tco_1570021 [Tanacetum coccineum]
MLQFKRRSYCSGWFEVDTSGIYFQGRPFQRNNAKRKCCSWNGGDSDYFKDKMLLMNAHENGVVLDEEQLLFLTGEQVTNFDDDVFEADQCDAFDSVVDEGFPPHSPCFMIIWMSIIEEDTRDMAEITRKRMMVKMQSPQCVENKLINDRKKAGEALVPKPLSHWDSIEDLKAQLEGNLKVATRSSVKPKVLAHALESVETVREIVEEARVVKPLDNVLNYACQYTKLSQELVEYVIGTLAQKNFTE